MDSIFHEKQEGSLCAQHCLNALLQGHYFTAVDLAEIARQLDDTERQQMAEGGVDTLEYKMFVQQASSNMDDSGFFSIQVIEGALSVWGLEAIPYSSSNPVASDARTVPQNQKAYVCNFREHWFSIRKLGNQWFNLNSLLTGPELLSNTYLSIFLTQLQQEGYSIFVVVGAVPECEADQLLKMVPAVQPVKPKLISQTVTAGAGASTSAKSGAGVSTDDLQRALQESQHLMSSQEDDDLQAAIRLSMEQETSDDKTFQKVTKLSAAAVAAEEERTMNTALDLSVQDRGRKADVSVIDGGSGVNESDDLKRALDLSRQGKPAEDNGAKPQVNVCDGQKCSAATEDSSNLSLAELRARRLAFLDKKPDGETAMQTKTADTEPGR
ncbi:ataxin-3-like isoform X2 [Lineus longissimus]|uniref:ataxin-3-like isoform X2 n=1 Tax=Lineus longissimus TaxID=88925 RepID=UPI00315DB223